MIATVETKANRWPYDAKVAAGRVTPLEQRRIKRALELARAKFPPSEVQVRDVFDDHGAILVSLLHVELNCGIYVDFDMKGRPTIKTD